MVISKKRTKIHRNFQSKIRDRYKIKTKKLLRGKKAPNGKTQQDILF